MRSIRARRSPRVTATRTIIRRRSVALAAAIAALLVVFLGAAPAQATTTTTTKGKADWGFVHLSSDASYCYAYAYLPQDMSVIAGTNNLYAGVEPYSWTASGWVKVGWKAMTAIPDKIVTDPGSARAKFYQPIKWNGITPNNYGVPVVFKVQRGSGYWSFIGLAYWRNSAQQVIGYDGGLNLSISTSTGSTVPYFNCN